VEETLVENSTSSNNRSVNSSQKQERKVKIVERVERAEKESSFVSTINDEFVTSTSKPQNEFEEIQMKKDENKSFEAKPSVQQGLKQKKEEVHLKSQEQTQSKTVVESNRSKGTDEPKEQLSNKKNENIENKKESKDKPKPKIIPKKLKPTNTIQLVQGVTSFKNDNAGLAE